MSYKAEYIWIDGQKPTAKLRSKGKVIADGEQPPVWGFDGSSTEQAAGDNSDCALKPVYYVPDPIRGGDHLLVMCEVFNADGTVHSSNHRAHLRDLSEKFKEEEFPKILVSVDMIDFRSLQVEHFSEEVETIHRRIYGDAEQELLTNTLKISRMALSKMSVSNSIFLNVILMLNHVEIFGTTENVGPPKNIAHGDGPISLSSFINVNIVSKSSFIIKIFTFVFFGIVNFVDIPPLVGFGYGKTILYSLNLCSTSLAIPTLT